MSQIRPSSTGPGIRQVRLYHLRIGASDESDSNVRRSEAISITIHNELSNRKSVYKLCHPCQHSHRWRKSVYDSDTEDETNSDDECEIHGLLQRKHHIYFTKQRNVAVSDAGGHEELLGQNIRCSQERMAVMGIYKSTSTGLENMSFLNEDQFSDINEQEYNSILSRFQFLTSYALEK